MRITAQLGDVESLRARIYQGESNLIQSAARMLDEIYDETLSSLKNQLPHNIPPEIFMESRYRERVKQCVLEAIYSEALCPELVILPKLYSPSFAAIPDLPIHLILVEYLPNVVHEVYPLMLDSYLYDLEHRGRLKRLVVCAHTSWLNENADIERGIFFLENFENPLEMDLKEPKAIFSAQFLCISPEEHQIWNERLDEKNISLVNPYLSAKHADNKYACYQRWKSMGAATPEAIKLNKGSLEKEDLIQAINKLSENNNFDKIVIQPNLGTEGRGAKAFEARDLSDDMLNHARQIAARDDVLIRRGVGNVKIVDEHGEAVHFDVRMNIIDGKVESGFFMLSAPGGYVSSPGMGGHVVEWTQRKKWTLQTSIHTLEFRIGDEIWNLMENTAEKSASIFPENQLLGIDLRLEWKEEQWSAWVLDCNPRPAGLSHSRYTRSGEPGVTQRLWHWLDKKN